MSLSKNFFSRHLSPDKTRKSHLDYSVLKLPVVKEIHRIRYNDSFPNLEGRKTLVFIGERFKWTKKDIRALDDFCSTYNTVCLCDHTSGYKGKYRVQSALLASQEKGYEQSLFTCDVLIHIGGISGDYYTMGAIKANEVWRVDEDGEMRDKFGKLSFIFEMPINEFFSHYAGPNDSCDNKLLSDFKKASNLLLDKLPDLPFSNTWIASQICKEIPDGAEIHLGILNSLRSWNFFEVPDSVSLFCNVGGFGIDGILSTMIGASLCNKSKIYYAVLGDLAFFYDINSIGNRNISPNIRILLINNGRGVEFHTYKHGASKFGDDTDKYIAAYGHNGRQSPNLVKDIASALGFEYLTASSKTEFNKVKHQFLSKIISDKPIIFEVFTERDNDADVLRLIRQDNGVAKKSFKQGLYDIAESIMGKNVVKSLSSIVK